MKIGSVNMNSTDKLLKLRDVKQEDCELLWEWANDPIVRASSFSSDFILWEDHVQWFTNKFNSQNSYLYIGLNGHDKPIGQIRFDVDSRFQAEVDISIDSQERGKGYGSELIVVAVKNMFQVYNIKFVHAFIKLNNIPSIISFKKAGFRQLNVESVSNGDIAFHYIYDRYNYN